MDIRTLTKQLCLLFICIGSVQACGLSKKEHKAVKNLTAWIVTHNSKAEKLIEKFGNKIICAEHFVLALGYRNYTIVEHMAKYTDVVSCNNYPLATSHASLSLINNLFNWYCLDQNLSPKNAELFINAATILTTFRPYIKSKSYDDYSHCLKQTVVSFGSFNQPRKNLIKFWIENRALKQDASLFKTLLDLAIQNKDKSLEKYLQIYSMAHHCNAVENNLKDFEQCDVQIILENHNKRKRIGNF